GHISESALRCNGPHFHSHAILESRTIAGNRYCFLSRVDAQEEITPNRFLGFNKWSVRHELSVLSGYDLALGHERLSCRNLALFGQSIEPGHPSICDLLQFLR